MVDSSRRHRVFRVWPAALAALTLVFALAVVFGGSPSGTSDLQMTTIPDLAVPPESQPLATSSDGPTPASANGYPAKPEGWYELDPGPLVSRIGVAAEWTGDRLLLWGGRDLRRGFTSGAIYAPSAADRPAWSTMPRPAIGGGAVVASTWAGRLLFVFTDAAAVFDPEHRIWSEPAQPPISIEPFTATWTGGEVVVVGRSLDVSEQTVAVGYGADGSCCRLLPSPPIDIDHGVAVWNGSEVVLIGGLGPSTDTALLATYDPETNAWKERGEAPLSGDPGLAAVWSGPTLVAIDADLEGGRWNEASGWLPVKPAPFDPLSCFTRLTVVGDDVFAWHCRQAAVYDPASGRWASVPTPELPSHSISTSCVPRAAGHTVFMWCGNGDGGPPMFYAVDLERVDPARSP